MEGLPEAGQADFLTVGTAILVMIVGLLVARLAERGAKRGIDALDNWMARQSTADSAPISATTFALIRGAVFWLVIVAAVFAALRVLGIGEFAAVFDNIANFVPRLLIALVIVAAGHLLGLLARGLLPTLSEAFRSDTVVPRLAHLSVLLLSVLIAIQALGIDISFITQLVLLLLLVTLGGMSLAFALGAQTYVANLIARSDLNRFSVGDRIRIDGMEGVILHIHGTGLELATAAGIVSIPAAKFSEVPVLRLAEESDDDN
jgi:small-conductance mechanosensitive channel